MTSKRTASLKDLISKDEPLIVPGVYDAISALVATEAGAKCLYMSGFSVAASLLAKPDIGLTTMSEMVERATQICGATNLPVIADGDTGYGDVHNVVRLTNAYEQAGVQCIQLEDQVMPKRCGHMENKQIVPKAEAAAKIRAAVNSRSNPNFLVMARTDAIACTGLDDALDRADAYLNAGADILFIEAPRSIEQMAEIRRRFPDTPLVANMVEDGKTPDLTPEALAELGYNVILRPVSALLAMVENLRSSYTSLVNTGALDAKRPRLSFQSLNQLLKLEDYN